MLGKQWRVASEVCLSPSVGVKRSSVIKAKLALLPDGKGKKSEEAEKESGRVGGIKKKGGKRALSMKREISGSFNFSLACWTAKGLGGGMRMLID